MPGKWGWDGLDRRRVGSKNCARDPVIIDLHTHTYPRSLDSFLSPEVLFERAREAGLDGICLTEHDEFWHAETLAEWSRRYGLLILPGCEVNTEEGHLLVYGLDRYVFGMHKAPFVRELVDRKRGAIVVSHPYRRRWRPSEGDALAAKSSGERVFGLADSIEVLNGRGSEDENRFSQALGRHLGTQGTGASDAHREEDVGTYATEFSRRVRCLGDLVAELRAGRFRAVTLRGGQG